MINTLKVGAKIVVLEDIIGMGGEVVAKKGSIHKAKSFHEGIDQNYVCIHVEGEAVFLSPFELKKYRSTGKGQRCSSNKKKHR